tara:strand:+ start:386 stop:562 length:177 start_codon:yes stop_codon:yes gene_type:complete
MRRIIKMIIEEKRYKDLTITKYHSCIAVSDIIDNQIIIKRYIGYNEKEAVTRFINEYR